MLLEYIRPVTQPGLKFGFPADPNIVEVMYVRVEHRVLPYRLDQWPSSWSR